MSTIYESDTMVKGQSLDPGTLPPMTVVDVADKPFSFEGDPEDIRISDRFDDASLDALVADLQFFDANGQPCSDWEKRRRELRNFLAFHGGSGVRELLTYRPRNIDGIDFYDPRDPQNYEEGHFVFGRIYNPPVLGFSAVVHVNQSECDKAHFRIRVPWFNASLKRDLAYSLNQSLYIGGEARDLVIRATYRVVRWQDPSGNHFYITELHNHSQLISTEAAQNPYNSPGGYSEMGRLPGVVSQINPGQGPGNKGPEFTLKRNVTFSIDLKLPYIQSLGIPGIEFTAKATTLTQVQIAYMLVSQFAYRLYNVMEHESDRRFEHYWAFR